MANRTTFAERQARTARASAARRQTNRNTHDDVPIEKENDEALAKEKKRASHFKEERDKSEKRARYWRNRAEEERDKNRELERERKELNREILLKDKEVEMNRSHVEEAEDKNRQQRESICHE